MSTVLHWRIIATMARGFAHTRSPSNAQHGASTSNPARISAGELYRRRTICTERYGYCEWMDTVCFVRTHVTSHGTESRTAS